MYFASASAASRGLFYDGQAANAQSAIPVQCFGRFAHGGFGSEANSLSQNASRQSSHTSPFGKISSLIRERMASRLASGHAPQTAQASDLRLGNGMICMARPRCEPSPSAYIERYIRTSGQSAYQTPVLAQSTQAVHFCLNWSTAAAQHLDPPQTTHFSQAGAHRSITIQAISNRRSPTFARYRCEFKMADPGRITTTFRQQRPSPVSRAER